MVSFVNALLYGVGGIVMAGMALLVAFQEKLVYVPVLPGLTKSYSITPSRLRLIYEDVWLRSSDGVRLHAWFIKLFPDCRGPIPILYSLFFTLCLWLIQLGFTFSRSNFIAEAIGYMQFVCWNLTWFFGFFILSIWF